jgi:exopolysaccharide biosynthesis polyprenyl glycosylphosphotransferase
VHRQGVERVIIALEDLDEQTLSHALATCRSLGVKLSVAPPLRAMLGTAVNLSHLAELPLIEFKTWDVARSTMLLKRTVDGVGASLGLLVLAPFMVVIAILIRLDSRGPALFVQERAGRDGAPFRMYKFRTMVADAERRLAEVVQLEDLVDPMFKLAADPRVTRAGRFLRRASLDELPQLWNVLRGDMSLVGPRPEEVQLVERYGEPERFRLNMPPGITGPMQIHGRGELTFQERLAVEREYVENYSFRKDLKILMRTLAVVLRRNGAF